VVWKRGNGLDSDILETGPGKRWHVMHGIVDQWCQLNKETTWFNSFNILTSISTTTTININWNECATHWHWQDCNNAFNITWLLSGRHINVIPRDIGWVWTASTLSWYGYGSEPNREIVILLALDCGLTYKEIRGKKTIVTRRCCWTDATFPWIQGKVILQHFVELYTPSFPPSCM
jgi:hypothetical protein